MTMNIYVGNLPWSASEEEISQLFAPHGEVISARIINDRETGRSRGFAFVEMENDTGQKAIEALTNASLGGRTLRINEAQPRPQRNRW